MPENGDYINGLETLLRNIEKMLMDYYNNC